MFCFCDCQNGTFFVSLTNKLKLFILKYFSLNHIAPNKIMLPLQGGVVTQGLKL